MRKKILLTAFALCVAAVGLAEVRRASADKKVEHAGSCCDAAPVAPTQAARASAQVCSRHCCVPGWDAVAGSDASVPANEQGFDPVCRHVIDRRRAVATRTANGVEFCFCSEKCLAEFERAPRDYYYCPVF
ncbi:MAG: hypothetical protein ACRELB_14445, partial [Polyangiaceae bacterium]